MNPKQILSLGASLSAVMLLSGCFGSSSSSSTDTPPPPPPPPANALYEVDESTFASRPAEAQTLFTEFQSLNDTDNRTTAELAGTASYTGRVSVDVDDAWLMSDIGLNANFDTSRVGGTLSGFYAYGDEGDGPIDGTLSFNDAEITANQFSDAALGGTLTSDGEDFVVTATIGGTFVGDDGGQVIGVIGGSVLDVSYNETILISGQYVADRD
ncbi:MAG: hypothetical protein ACK4GT_09495 [Pararhodobacter sp.]